MSILETLLAASAILSSWDDIYKCPACGEPLILTPDPDCPWEMKDGKWTHNCNGKIKNKND